MPGAPGCQDIGTTRCKLVTPSEATLREATGAFPDLPARYPTRAVRDSGGEWAELGGGRRCLGAPRRQDIGWNSDEAQARLHALAFAAA